jgi:hypothetical protein
MKKWKITMFFLQEEDAQRQEHTQGHQAQMIVSFANLMASNSSLECSMSLDLGFDTIDVVQDGERNGSKTQQNSGLETQQGDMEINILQRMILNPKSPTGKFNPDLGI